MTELTWMHPFQMFPLQTQTPARPETGRGCRESPSPTPSSWGTTAHTASSSPRTRSSQRARRPTAAPCTSSHTPMTKAFTSAAQSPPPPRPCGPHCWHWPSLWPPGCDVGKVQKGNGTRGWSPFSPRAYVMFRLYPHKIYLWRFDPQFILQWAGVKYFWEIYFILILNC